MILRRAAFVALRRFSSGIDDEMANLLGSKTHIPAPDKAEPDARVITKLSSKVDDREEADPEVPVIASQSEDLGEAEPEVPIVTRLSSQMDETVEEPTEEIITWLGERPPEIDKREAEEQERERLSRDLERFPVEKMKFDLLPKLVNRIKPKKIKDRREVPDALVKVMEEALDGHDYMVTIDIRLWVNPRNSSQFVRGITMLPHGIGRNPKIAVFAEGAAARKAIEAGVELVGGSDLIQRVLESDGSIMESIDNCIATPSMMAAGMAKLGKLLGPKGLMPNPRTGTLTDNIKEAIDKIRQGQIEFRLDRSGNLHCPLGKASFGKEKLTQNTAVFLSDVLDNRPEVFQQSPIESFFKNVTLSCTRGRGYPVLISSISKLSRFDEYLWTKGSWLDLKLDKATSSWRVDDSPLVYKETSLLRESGCKFISSEGPRSTTVEGSDTRGASLDWFSSMFENAIATEALFEAICPSVVEAGWRMVKMEIYDKQKVDSAEIKIILKEACLQRSEELLIGHDLIKEGEGYRLIQTAEDDLSIDAELAQMACSRFSNRNSKELVEEFEPKFKLAVLELGRVLRQHESRQIKYAHSQEARLRAMGNECIDLHPKCEAWADIGECKVNPLYMLKFCKISCGVCEAKSPFEEAGKYYLDQIAIADLDQTSLRLELHLKSNLCSSYREILQMDLEDDDLSEQ